MKIFILVLFCLLELFIAEKISVITIQRPVVPYFSHDYFSNVTVTASRYNRRNPIYYFSVSGNLLQTFGDSMGIDFAIYELQGTGFKRSYLNFHIQGCNIVNNPLFGEFLKMKFESINKKCPFNPGYYELANITAPSRRFPKIQMGFSKGRIECTFTDQQPMKVIAKLNVDFETKLVPTNKVDLVE